MIAKFFKLILFIQFYIFSIFIIPNFSFAETPVTGSIKEFGPFISNFEIPSDWKSDNNALSKANKIFTNDDIQSEINLALSAPRDGVLIVSWQFFESSMAFSADQLTSSIPTFEFVKKADTKVSPSSTNNANRFEYAIYRATGFSNDNLTFTSKGKSRLVGYWVNLPIQFKNSKDEMLSGMLSVFYRGSETESKKNKIDSVIPAFMNSLEFKEGFSKISYEKYKSDLAKEKIKNELIAEMAKESNKSISTDNANKTTSPKSTPNIVDFYMVDSEGICYRFEEKNSYKKVICPVH